MMKMVTDEGEHLFEPRDYEVILAGAAPLKRSIELGATQLVRKVFSLVE